MVPEIYFAYPGRRIEEKRKPAYPRPELDPADGLNSIREIEGRPENFAKHLHSTIFGITFPIGERQ